MGFAKHYKVIEALISDRLDEALSVRITVWALRRDGDARDAVAFKKKFPRLREQRITVVDQELGAAKEAIHA